MRVALTDEELLTYAGFGCQRLISALSKQRVGAHGFNRNHERWQIDIEGLLAEFAVAKALSLPYTPTVGSLDTHDGDVAPGLQVRSTKYGSGSLLVHDKDLDDHRYVLVTGIYGVYDLRGWIYAKEGKVKSLWKEYKGRGAYWVPQDKLRPMDTLAETS